MRTVALSLLASLAVASPALAETFSGPYLGIEIGLDNYETKLPGVNGVSQNGVVGGVYAGYDIPLSSSIFAGVEANASLSDAKSTVDDGTDVFRLKSKESFGASARLGAMLNDSTGVYGRVGWVNTKFKASVNGVGAGSDNDDALALGGGIETRVGSNASVRLEYTYADYSDSVSNNQIKAGVAYRF